MTEIRNSGPDNPSRPEAEVRENPHPEMEEYAGGTIQSIHGYIPVWLLVVYIVLFIWALYYLVVYWGGLGPGRV
ncbi:hypothetical protein IVB18_13480 [Bradyrhizobium sp. 186]|uniref:hypothetical protein n=1 Tax=Bradyrhizobium sp. 186 TaxID=2782654 RepID=UPI0020008873|nr:hypothetical protein [Bradyrhizobium sp. 186]UPK38182.1 hypothetical protein IVB18_13480 [Bradyrhizobium sp. 186]